MPDRLYQAIEGAIGLELDGRVFERCAVDLLRKAYYADLRGTPHGRDAGMDGISGPDSSTLITDEYRAYRAVRSVMPHETIPHSERFADGDIHTNTIEGFWSLLKRAWYGTHHHYKEHYTPLYGSRLTGCLATSRR